jgi:hypothetical protein
VLVNPRVIWRSKQLELFCEGCLSFNTVVVAVRRAFAVRVVGYDVSGNELEFQCEDFEASLMQHEVDHLDGILTLHRADHAPALPRSSSPPAAVRSERRFGTAETPLTELARVVHRRHDPAGAAHGSSSWRQASAPPTGVTYTSAAKFKHTCCNPNSR